ncbi:MAG TPA: Asp-tRNA(Asn)/Glu-tRNA(Gln) amidotransferase subunit GatB [Chloroflexota bacterium]|nr:Asp-tRNA(Asn)/Glu-tRNA(Gln) amidotransferase subunit GatB [Chloroflexota bacterium]
MATELSTRELSATDYELVIGLEVHTELRTRSKMFCACSADWFGKPPNSQVCPVCLALPGALPVINKQAIEYAIMVGLALHADVENLPNGKATRFDRKNYTYPDLPKGYQITQMDIPVNLGGWLEIVLPDGDSKRVGVTRAHQEEDTAKLIHRVDDTGEAHSLVDFNRAGVPLLEIVSEPDMRSPEEAVAYLRTLRNILLYLGVTDARMEEGSFRCDANCSIRPAGSTEFGRKVEVKNMNSFRSVERALRYEYERQKQALANGEVIPQETRGWDEDKGITVSQRSKEYAHDYRYFPEPDLPPLFLAPEWIEAIKQRLPELPAAKKARYVQDHGLATDAARVIADDPAYADFFESALFTGYSDGKHIATWMLGDLTRLLRANNAELSASLVTPSKLVDLLKLIDGGQISGKIAKDVLEEMFATGAAPGDVVRDKGLLQISDDADLERACAAAIAANPQSVADFHAGKERALQFLVGQVMKETKGRANPGKVNDILRKQLES